MRKFSLQELAQHIGGEVNGDGSVVITGAETIRDVSAGQITFATNPKYIPQLQACAAAAAVVPVGVEVEGLPTIQVEDVVAAFTQVVTQFRPPRTFSTTGISPQANIHESAQIDSSATIHAGATIGAEVVIGANSVIHSGATILDGTTIGNDTVIFPGVVIYENCIVGSRNILHANAVLGAYGFGYDSSSGRHILSAQLGNVVLGDDVEIGCGTTIDRGTFGSTTIGDGTKIDNQVMIGHNCRIGKHNLLCSQVGIAGSCSTGDYVVMAGQVGIGDHLDIEDRAVLAAKAGVMTRIPAGETWVGIPATPMREQVQKLAAVGKLPELRKQFRQLQKQVAALESQLADKSSGSSEQNKASRTDAA